MDGGSTETNRAGGGLAEVGAMLRRRREEIGRDLATIAATTHIRQNYLKAIEEGRRRDLPGTAYMIGYVRTYADYLGFDGDRLITDYHAELTAQRKKPEKQVEAAEAPAGASQIQTSPLILVAAMVVLILAVFFLWRHFSSDDEDVTTAAIETPAETAPAPEAAEPAPAEQPAATPASPSPTGAEASAPSETEPAPAAEPPAATGEDQVPPEADVASTSEGATEQSPPQEEQAAVEPDAKAGKVVVRARLESWIQITNAKKEVVFSRVLRAGETYTVPEEAGLMLTTGNAGGVEILLNGKKLKSLGTVGLVRRDLPLDPKKLKDGSAFKPPKAVTN